jgi:hypothetical protein
MRSQGDGVAIARITERGLRAASFALIAFAVWRLLGAGAAGGMVRLRSSSLARELPSIEPARDGAVHVDIDAMPSPADRDALAAVAHAGTRVTWSSAAIPPLAAVAVRAREPGAPVRVEVASTVNVSLSDGLAALDSVNAAGAARGASLSVGAPSGALAAASGAARSPIGIPAPALLHPVLLVGRAGWEAKFAAAALEEQGWSVVERLFVAPTADVTQGAIGVIDTNHFSAIVAVDTTLGAVGPSIVRFVRDGGGLLLLADAANAPAVRAIAPARAGARQLSGKHAFDVADPVGAMPVYPLESVRGDVVRLTTRGTSLTSAARREGAGRVLQAGFDETWRWRMQGGTEAVAAHRAWWSRMVGSVAATPLDMAAAAGDATSAEGAPLARLIGALGPAATVEPPASEPRRLPSWLLPLLLICLLAEWGSRRWRGAQ